MSNEFAFILDELSAGRSAELSRTIGKKRYKRTFLPSARLIILGGGNVSAALCRAASVLDFEITVVDDRPAFANTEKLPDADRIICTDFEKAIASLNIGEGDYVCVLTRGHRFDAACVRRIMSNSMPYYLGMMGSKRRSSEFKNLLTEEGFSRELTEQLHAPIGISIGASAPDEIAISICAELISQKSMRASATDSLKITDPSEEVLAALADDSIKKAMLMVIETEGSTPVKPGKIMCLKENFETVGTIGGGYAEAIALNKAKKLIETGGSGVVETDLSGDVAEELGMVCGGKMLVYIESV